MAAYYNEFDPYAAQWLRNLIAAGYIAPGDVDERSLSEVQPDDLKGYTQCHFFAGIGVWSHALRQAGWADDRPIWTGSCPCQPFSAAGKRKGFDDERHLWPVWFRLIDERRPAIVVGEQVASVLGWLDLVSADMEDAGYAIGVADLCAAGFGGAHIRQRLYFVGVEFSGSERREWGQETTPRHEHDGQAPERAQSQHGVGEPDAHRFSEHRTYAPMLGRNAADWLLCRDGKWRPVEPGSFPLAHETPSRMGRLRAYGNALDAETATQFCAAVKDICDTVEPINTSIF